MKGSTILRVFGVLFVLIIFYRSEADARARPEPRPGPIALALANPWPHVNVGRVLLGKLVGRASKKALTRLTGATTMALGQAAGIHVADKIFGPNKRR